MIFIRLLSAVLFVIGLAGFFAPFWLGQVKGVESFELPLAEVHDVAVAPDKRIYFALMHLGRVQVYAGDGTFIRNFEVRNAGGAFCLDIAGDRLTVAVARRDATDTFDLDGKLIFDNTPITEEQYDETCRSDPRIRSRDWAASGVTLTFVDGARLVLARQPWHYVALHPFWSWLMVMVALFLWPEWRRGIFDRIKGRSAK